MKKLILCAAVVLAAVAGTVYYHSESRNENEMSDLARANVKALAEEVKPSDSDCIHYCKADNNFICHVVWNDKEGTTCDCYRARRQ